MEAKRKRRPLTAEEQRYAQELIRKYDKTIRRVVKAYLDLALKGELEDVVQSVYEAICCQLNDFKTYDSPEALVFTIASRAAWRLNKAWKETVSLTEELPAREPDRSLEDLLPGGISEEDKSLLISVYQHRDTAKEAAEDRGMKPEVVRQKLKRLRARMRKEFEKT